MVAITNRQRHGGAGRLRQASVRQKQRHRQGLPARVDLLHQRGVLHGPTGQVAAVQHQRAIIQQRQLRLMSGNGFNQGTGFIVGQHHHMRGFHWAPRRILSRGGMRATTVLSLGRMAGFAAFFKAVLFQVHSTNQTLADGTVHLGALHIHIAMYTAGQQVIAVILHGRTDRRKARFFLRGSKVSFRQNNVQGAGFALCQFLRFLPVFRLGGKLIHRNAGPRVQRGRCTGQQDISRDKTILHGNHFSFTDAVFYVRARLNP